MVSEPAIVVYDACVLYPFHLRNLLVQFAVEGVVHARWSDTIHEEWIRNLAQGRGIPRQRLIVTRDLMNEVLPDADVRNYKRLIPGITLPDKNDRHVLATAIASGASTILTWNMKHFPKSVTVAHGVMAHNPDRFLTALATRDIEMAAAVVDSARANLRRTVPTAKEYLTALQQQGLKSFVKKLQRHL